MESAKIFLCDKLSQKFLTKMANYGSCHIMFLTQFKQCDGLIASSDKPSNDYHPNGVVTYTNCIDGMSAHPCHLNWHVVDLEELKLGEVLAV